MTESERPGIVHVLPLLMRHIGHEAVLAVPGIYRRGTVARIIPGDSVVLDKVNAQMLYPDRPPVPFSQTTHTEPVPTLALCRETAEAVVLSWRRPALDTPVTLELLGLRL